MCALFFLQGHRFSQHSNLLPLFYRISLRDTRVGKSRVQARQSLRVTDGHIHAENRILPHSKDGSRRCSLHRIAGFPLIIHRFMRPPITGCLVIQQRVL